MNDKDTLKQALERFKKGELSEQDLLSQWLDAGTKTVGAALLDTNRANRKGFPEVVLAQGKTREQVCNLLESLAKEPFPALASRVDSDLADRCLEHFPQGIYFEDARLFWANPHAEQYDRSSHLAVICAGMADLPVAEEAAVLLEIAGYDVTRVYDVGVAGLQRLLTRLQDLQEAEVLLTVAGMDGALPSVVAGLMEQAVIAVPTSTGYGAALDGLAPLLTMLNTCAPGIATVNIDNGYGAAMMAHAICRRIEKGKP